MQRRLRASREWHSIRESNGVPFQTNIKFISTKKKKYNSTTTRNRNTSNTHKKKKKLCWNQNGDAGDLLIDVGAEYSPPPAPPSFHIPYIDPIRGPHSILVASPLLFYFFVFHFMLKVGPMFPPGWYPVGMVPGGTRWGRRGSREMEGRRDEGEKKYGCRRCTLALSVAFASLRRTVGC